VSVSDCIKNGDAMAERIAAAQRNPSPDPTRGA